MSSLAAPFLFFLIKFLKKAAPLPTNVAESLRQAVYDGTLDKQILEARAYVKTKLYGQATSFTPLGLGCPILTVEVIQKNLREQESRCNTETPTTYFCGTLAMLDLDENCEDELDLAKLKNLLLRVRFLLVPEHDLQTGIGVTRTHFEIHCHS